tara:strand:+ start:289 stop:2343 length:2055 start_codon:yes stop_codon:yes gene_type:complete
MHEDEMTIVAVEEEDTEPTMRRKALVSHWLELLHSAKGYHESAFRQMKTDMDSAYRGYDPKKWDDDNYVANILQRHVQQRTASLYAKNPKAVCKRRQRMDFQFWDGDEKTLAMAYDTAAQASASNLPVPPQASQIIQDWQNGTNHRKMLDNVAKTMESLFDYFMNEQQPAFKTQMKSLVRRVITTGVGYVKVGFQREVDRSPEVSSKIADVQAQIDNLTRIAKQAVDGDITQDDPQIEELQLSMKALLSEEMMIVREGLVFDFPESNSIIIDPMCRELKGFIGARWIAHEMYLTPDEIMEIYGVDVGDKFTEYDLSGRSTVSKEGYSKKVGQEDKESLAVIYEVYDKKSGLQYCLCDGYDDFLREPMSPDVKVETFFPINALVFNDVEHKNHLYPPSDIKLLMPMQNEYNRARQGLREHRRANRPKYATPAGMLEEEDKIKLANHPANAVLELQALASGQKVNDVIQPVQQIGIDPNLYEVRTIFDDVQLVVGAQESTFGGVSKATATETSIAESSRMSSLGANVDDLDTFMSEIARSAGQILLQEMSIDEVRKIVGVGAVFPTMTREQIMDEIYLEVEAGSTGKPNRAAELQNIERIMPFLLQIPGIDPKWLAKELLKRLDDKLDITSAIAEQIPSIVAMNQNQGEGTGSPALQGIPQGGANNQQQIGAPTGGSLPPMGANNV